MPSTVLERITFPLKVDYHNIWCELKIKPNSENILTWFNTELYQEVEHLLQDEIQEHIKASKSKEPTFSNKDAKVLLKGPNFKVLYFFKPSKHLPPDVIHPMAEEALWDNASNASLEENEFKNFGGLFKKHSILKFSVHATVEPLDNEDQFVSINVAETKVTDTNYFQEIPVDKETAEKDILKRITHDIKKHHKLKKRKHKKTLSLCQTSNALRNYSQSTDTEATCEKEDTSNVPATSDDTLGKNILSANDSKTETLATQSEFTNSTRSQRPNKSTATYEVQDNADVKSNSHRKSPKTGQESRKLKKDKTSSVTSTFSATEMSEDSPREHNLRAKGTNVYYEEPIVFESETPPKKDKTSSVASTFSATEMAEESPRKHNFRAKGTNVYYEEPMVFESETPPKKDKTSSVASTFSATEMAEDSSRKHTFRAKGRNVYYEEPRVFESETPPKKEKTSVASTFSATEMAEEHPRKHNLRAKYRNVYYGDPIVFEPETIPKRQKEQKITNDDGTSLTKSPNKSVDDKKDECEKKATKLKLRSTKSQTDSKKMDKSSSQSQPDSTQEKIKDSKSIFGLKKKSKSVKEPKKLQKPNEPIAHVCINLDGENSLEVDTCKLSPAKSEMHTKKTSEIQFNDSFLSFLKKNDRLSSSLCHTTVTQQKGNQSSLQENRVSRLLTMFKNNIMNDSASDFACDEKTAKRVKLKKTSNDEPKTRKKRELKWRIPPEYTRKKESYVQGSLDSFVKASTSCQSSSNSLKTSQSSLPGTHTGDAELVCMGVSHASDEQIQAEIDQIKDLKMLKEYQLKYLFKKYLPTLLKIQKGEVYSERHEIYYGDSIMDKINLTYRVYFNLFTEDQVDYIMELLMNEFSKTDYELVNYQLKVLLSEILIHIHMEITGLSHDESDEVMGKAMLELSVVN